MTLLALTITGCHSVPPPPAITTPVHTSTYPTRPSTPPPPFHLFHHTDTSFTLVTKDNATDDEIKALLWQLRDAAQTHTLDKLHIDQKAVNAGKPTVWFHIYRGAKCASEKYAPGKTPCGDSYHAAADYTFGSSTNPRWDDGILRKPNDVELPLWNPDAPYKTP